MRKLIMWNVVTLDGYFEGAEKWDLAFHNLVWGDELETLSIAQLHAADYLLFGRITYEGMAAYWTNEVGQIADLMNSIPKIVCSQTLQAAAWNNTTLYHENVAEKIAALKRENGKDIYIFGSADLCDTLISNNLFDEYRICIAPVILGKGTPLFKSHNASTQLTLTEAKSLKNGGVFLRYT